MKISRIVTAMLAFRADSFPSIEEQARAACRETLAMASEDLKAIAKEHQTQGRADSAEEAYYIANWLESQSKSVKYFE